MEPIGAHPVPQNVTSFEFHLVGDMTLKQFTYLATGLAIGYLTFIFLAAPAPIIAWPIIVISVLAGVAFAFLPIQERPLDHWVLAFFKAIFQPTQRVWKPLLGNMPDAKINDYFQRNRLSLYLSQAGIITPPTPPPLARIPSPNSIGASPASQPQPKASPPLTSKSPVEFKSEVITVPPTPSQATTPKELPSDEQLRKTVDLAKQAQTIQVKIVEAEKQLNQIKTAAATPGSQSTAFTQQFNTVFANLQTLIKHAQEISHSIAEINAQKLPIKRAPITQAQPATLTSPQAAQLQKLQLTTFPNVINGIITDGSGNFLENVVVVIHNKDGLPVRAMKTNKLGQFTGATPLPAGKYTVSSEKEGFTFDIVEVSLENTVMPPMEIKAKPAASA